MQRKKLEFSAVIAKEDKWFVALCPELDIASQGKTVEKALSNLKEALELYLTDEDIKLPENNESPIVTIIKVEVDEKTRIERNGKESERDRLKKLEAELRKKLPDIKVDKDLLRLVGTEPYNPHSQDKEIVRRIVAERFG